MNFSHKWQIKWQTKKIIILGFPSRRSEKFNKLSCTSNDFFKVSGGCSLCLSVCLASHEQYFSYLATVTNAWDRAANLDLCLALTTFNSEDSFTCHTYSDTGTIFFKVISERPVILPSKCYALGEWAITTDFKRLRFGAAGSSEARTYSVPFAKREHYH